MSTGIIAGPRPGVQTTDTQAAKHGKNNTAARQSPLANRSPELAKGLNPSGRSTGQAVISPFLQKPISAELRKFEVDLNACDSLSGAARTKALEKAVQELEADCAGSSKNPMTMSDREKAIKLVKGKLPSGAGAVEKNFTQGAQAALARRLDAVESISAAQSVKAMGGDFMNQYDEFKKALTLATKAGPSHAGVVYPALFGAVNDIRSQQYQSMAKANLQTAFTEFVTGSVQGAQHLGSAGQYAEFDKALGLASRAGPSLAGVVYPALIGSVRQLKSQQDQSKALIALAPTIASLNEHDQTEAVRDYFGVVETLPLQGQVPSEILALMAVQSGFKTGARMALQDGCSKVMITQLQRLQATRVDPGNDGVLRDLEAELNAGSDQQESVKVLRRRDALEAVIQRNLSGMNSEQQRRTLGLVKAHIDKFSPGDQAAMIGHISDSLGKNECDPDTAKAFADLMPSLSDAVINVPGPNGNVPLSLKFNLFFRVACLKPMPIALLLDNNGPREGLNPMEREQAGMAYKRHLGQMSLEEFERHILPLSEDQKTAARKVYNEARTLLAGR